MFRIKASSQLPSSSSSLLIIIFIVVSLTFITRRAAATSASTTATAANHNKGCVIPFSSKKDWDVFWPLIFHTNGSLIHATQTTTATVINNDNNNGHHEHSSVVLISDGEEVLISCSPNYIKERPPTEYVTAVCQNNGKFIVKDDGNDDPIAVRDLKCDLRAIEEVLEPISDCPTKSTAVHFGYVNPVDNSAQIIGEACYNMRKGQTIFAHIHSPTSILTPHRKETKSFLKKAHPPTGYKVQLMKSFQFSEFNDRLKNILNIDSIPWFEMVNYIDEDLLGNQHQYYAPTKKLSWNYLVLHENLMNLKLLKKDVNNLMMETTMKSMRVDKKDDNSKNDNNNNNNQPNDYNDSNDDDDDIDVYIGSHGVIKLKNSIGNNVPIYVDGINEKFPIPEIVWIIVKKSNKATAFAILNNPLLAADDITNNNLYCHSKCDKITWLKQTGSQEVYLNGKHGGIICCDYNEFKKSVEEVPNLKDIKELFI